MSGLLPFQVYLKVKHLLHYQFYKKVKNVGPLRDSSHACLKQRKRTALHNTHQVARATSSHNISKSSKATLGSRSQILDSINSFSMGGFERTSALLNISLKQKEPLYMLDNVYHGLKSAFLCRKRGKSSHVQTTMVWLSLGPDPSSFHLVGPRDCFRKE